MSEDFRSEADYMILTKKWRDRYGVAVGERSWELRQANEVISGLDREVHAEFFSDAAAWRARQDAKAAAQPVPDTERIKQQLANIPIGKYLMLSGYFIGSMNHTIEQGTLQSIDWDNGTVVLHSLNYDRDNIVDINKILSIDESRSGSGALGSVQEPDLREVSPGVWYRGDKKVE